MPHLLTRLALLACAALAAAAHAESPEERAASGTWYGEHVVPEGRLQRFITTRHPDGTFTIAARLYEGGKLVSQVQNDGYWGVSHGLYFTYTRVVNGQEADRREPALTNIYLLKRLNADEMEYQHVASGANFRVTRADPEWVKLPD